MFIIGVIETKTKNGFKLKNNPNWYYVGNYRTKYLAEIPINTSVNVTYDISLSKIGKKPYNNVIRIENRPF